MDRPLGNPARARVGCTAVSTVSTAVTGGYVVPVDGDPIEGGTVLMAGGRIVAVGPEADVDVPDDAEIVDASGTWVLPGFV